MSRQVNDVSTSIRKTVVYSSLFHFPLTKDELWRYVISDTKIPQNEFEKTLRESIPFVLQKNGYYFLRDDTSALEKREKEKELYSTKLSLAKKAAAILSCIPTIYFIGISGSLAAGSAPEESDIDFFIITAANTVWITRLIALILISSVGLRRKRKSKQAPNKICLNIFMSEDRMDYFTSTQDVYTAHEIAQLYPLLNRHKTYEYFLTLNKWYYKFLPHALPRTNRVITWTFPSLIVTLLKQLDTVVAFLQMRYMKRHQTNEIVKKDHIFLHPHNYRTEILAHFQRKLIEYDLLTKE